MNRRKVVQDFRTENLWLAYHIIDEVLEHPELRFQQILWALGVIDDKDRFYELPKDTIRRVKEKLNEL